MRHNFSTSLKLMAAGLVGAVAMLSAPEAFASEPASQNRTPYFEGVGPAMAGSFNVNNLPKKAIHFLENHFGTAQVSQCVKDYDDNAYEVDLSNGIDIEFDARGEWREVDAPSGKALPSEVVDKLLPVKARKELRERGLSANVESVKHGRGGYIVDITDNMRIDGELAFNNEGHFIGIIDD